MWNPWLKQWAGQWFGAESPGDGPAFGSDSGSSSSSSSSSGRRRCRCCGKDRSSSSSSSESSSSSSSESSSSSSSSESSSESSSSSSSTSQQECVFCPCCPEGYWTEYTFTIADLIPILDPFAVCDGYNGTWTLKYRGTRSHLGESVCVWSTDERTDGEMCEGDVVNHPFDIDPNPERWLLYCLDGEWTLISAGTTVKWVATAGVNPLPDFCTDGGELLYSFADTSGCCKWNGFSVYPTESNYLSVIPSGGYITC